MEGDSAACLSYTLVADQSWGGSIDMQFVPADGMVFTDMTGEVGLSFWYKVTEPADMPSNVSFVVKVFVNSTGGTEEWQKTVTGVLADDSGEWVQALVPFSSFSIPSWLATYDGVLYQDQVAEIQFQILASQAAVGSTTAGGICFDKLTSYGEAQITGTVEPAGAEVKVFPNPASSQLFIEGLDNIELVQTFDMNGRLLKTDRNPYASLDVSGLRSGFYVLKIYTGKRVYSAKFLKH